MKLRITNNSRERAVIKYKGLKDGGVTYVDLQGSVAAHLTFVSPIDVLPGSIVSVKLENHQLGIPDNEMQVPARLSQTLYIEERIEQTLVYR
jgi:hypothetical protein